MLIPIIIALVLIAIVINMITTAGTIIKDVLVMDKQLRVWWLLGATAIVTGLIKLFYL